MHDIADVRLEIEEILHVSTSTVAWRVLPPSLTSAGDTRLIRLVTIRAASRVATLAAALDRVVGEPIWYLRPAGRATGLIPADPPVASLGMPGERLDGMFRTAIAFSPDGRHLGWSTSPTAIAAQLQLYIR